MWPFKRTSHTTPKSNSHLKICFITSESGIPGDNTQNSERKIPNGQNFGIVSDRYSRSEEEKLQQVCWFFPHLLFFSFQGRFVFFLWLNWLGTYWSLGLCPRMTTGLFLMDPFFFFAVYEEDKKEEIYKYYATFQNCLRIPPFSTRRTY